MLNNTKTQSRPKWLFLYQLLVKPIKVLKILKTFLSRPIPRPRLLPQDQDSGSQDQDQDQDFIFVLEATRDQDFGLEDYITAASGIQQIPPYVQPRWTLASYRELRLRDRIFAVAGPHGFESVYQFTSSFPPLKTRYSQNSKDCF